MNTPNSICVFAVACVFFSCNKGDSSGTVNGPKPVASFLYNNVVGSLPKTVTFYTTTVSQPNSTYSWNFGDGTTSSVVNPTHNYSANGTYQVKLTHSYTGGSASYTSPITISTSQIGTFGAGASGSFGYSVSSLAPFTATFINNSTNATSYLWAFGDGSTSTSTNGSFTHAYAATGTYTIKLTATGNGGTDTTSTSLYLAP